MKVISVYFFIISSYYKEFLLAFLLSEEIQTFFVCSSNAMNLLGIWWNLESALLCDKFFIKPKQLLLKFQHNNNPNNSIALLSSTQLHTYVLFAKFSTRASVQSSIEAIVLHIWMQISPGIIKDPKRAQSLHNQHTNDKQL